MDPDASRVLLFRILNRHSARDASQPWRRSSGASKGHQPKTDGSHDDTLKIQSDG